MRYLLLFALLFACNLEPKYNTPQPSVEMQETNNNIIGISWKEFIISPQLHKLINKALENNQDLKTAHLNIESARTMYGIERAKLIPNINATASVTRQEAPSRFQLFMPTEMYRANPISITAYELDFFGKVRNMSKSAYEQYLATEEAKNITRITLIAETSNAYIQLLADQEILNLIEKSMSEQKKQLNLIKERRKYGRAFQIDVILSETEYENIKVLHNSYSKAVDLDTNALMLLIGDFNKNTIQSTSLKNLVFKEDLIEFMPSKTLLSRPDIKQAEHKLRAANADIGVARAAFFPSITLTGNYGYFTPEFSELIDSKSWSIMPEITLPIFNGGKNKRNLKLSKIEKQILVSNYQKTLQTAFKEVLDELANRKAILENIESYNNIVKLSEESYDIIKQQYTNGKIDAIIASNSYLKVVTAKQNTVIEEANRMKNLVTLYKALGGGSELPN